MIGLCNHARVSKSKIRYILSRFNTLSKKVNTKKLSKCSNCNIKQNNSSFKINFNQNDKNSLNEIMENYCSNYCNKSDDTFEEFYYVYEKEVCYGQAEIITDSFKTFNLNKSAIKQYLVYHFIPGNQNWLKKSVSFNDIASLCNLSLPTVKKNHKLLVEAGLICSTDLGLGKFNFIIVDEYKNHLRKDEGGTGYITLSLHSLKHLINFNSINELRVELLKFLWVDARTGSIGKNVKFKKENLIEYLPNYIKKSKNRIEDIINSKNSLFKCINNKKLNTSNYETSDALLSRLRKEAKEKIINLFKGKEELFSANCSKLLLQIKQANPYLDFIKEDLIFKLDAEKKIIIKDLSGLVVEYNFEKVESAIRYMLSDSHVEIDSDLNIQKTDIKKPGAFIRTLITNSINNNGSLQNEVV